MIAAVVRFEVKDEVKKLLADINVAEVYIHTASLTDGVLI